MKNLNKSRLIFSVIALFYAITNFIYWLFNTPILPYSVEALHFMDVFREGLLYYNAPFIPLIIKTFFYWFGMQYFDLIIIFVNYIFFLSGLYCIYKIGAFLHSKNAGTISMILFSLTPAIYSLSRFYGRQDYHVMIMMIVSIYCLIQTNLFIDRKWVFLYSISASIGLLCKDSFLIYFIIPYICILYFGLKNNLCKKVILNVFFSFVFILLLTGWHYLRPIIILKMFFEPVSEVSNSGLFNDIYKLTFGLSEELLSFSFFILSVISLIWYLIKYKNKYKLLLLIWLVVPWLTLLLIRHYKATVFCVGIIPAMIIISSIFIDNIDNNKTKKIIIFGLLFIGLFQFVEYSYDCNFLFKNIKIKCKDKVFYYLNEEPNIINHNKKYISGLQDLLHNITKYRSNKIYLSYNQSDIKLKFYDFLIYMYLKGVFFNYDTVMSWTDCSTVDTIIYVGSKVSLEKQLEINVKDIEEHPVSKTDNIDIKHYSDEFMNFLIKREKFILENFVLDKEFVSDDNCWKDNKITVFVKNQFE